MLTRLNRFWLVSLALAWFWDFLFWERVPGISFALFVVLCILSGMYLLYSHHLKPHKTALWVLLPIAFFAVLTFIRQEPFSLWLSFGCTLLLLQILAMTIVSGNWPSFGFVDYFLGFLRLWQSIIVEPSLARSQLPKPSNENKTKTSSRYAWQVARGILLALPVVIIFALLLSSADLVFAQKIGSFFNLFSFENLPEYIVRLLLIVIIAYALVGAYIHALKKSATENLHDDKEPQIPLFLGFTESTIVLGSVTLLFTAFVIIQFQYFFGGQTNIHIDGYTYSEYARRGFGELLAVAIFTLVLFLNLSHLTRREYSLQRKIFSALSALMVGLVGIILISAFQRLLLYETIYGFTRLRAYTHVFMIWLGALLVITVLLEIFHHLRFFTNATIFVTLGFTLTINLLNVDGLIVQRNSQRAVQGEEIDVAYLASLSTDAVPTLVSLFQSPNVPPETRDALGTSLACMIRLNPSIQSPVKNWQSFQLSHWWATNALRAVENQLSGYPISFINFDLQVTSPENRTFPCQSDWMGD